MYDYKKCRKIMAARLERYGYLKKTAGSDFDKITDIIAKMYGHKNAGILFVGVAGCGKTTAAKAIFPTTPQRRKQLIEQDKDYITPVHLFELENRKSVARLSDDYDWMAYHGQGINVFLDDLGADQPIIQYGQRICYTSEFLFEKYKKFERGETGRLIVTTNMTSDQLTERYGERVIDRLISMMAICKLDGKSKRRNLDF